jgi:hypothetical protein
MSENTMIKSQIQMKNSVNQMIDQKTWPVPNSANIELSLCDLSRGRVPAPGRLPG